MRTKFKLSRILILIAFLFVGYFLTNMFRTKRLTEKEKEFIPYTANQILIFESNKSITDTITITEISLTKHPPNLGDMFWAKNTEILKVQTDVKCKNCNEIMYLGTENFSFDTNISWTIRLNEKNYTFGTNQKSIDKIEKIKLTVNGIEFDDVLVLERAKQFERPKDNISKMFYKGIYPIDKLYWSESNGIIKFEIIETSEIWKIKNALQHRV